jgi:DNA-binding CsgD family transcriptional regulator
MRWWSQVSSTVRCAGGLAPLRPLRRELDDKAIAGSSASPRIARAARLSRKDTAAMRRRMQRLQRRLIAADKPIIWLCAGPGTGKSRLLQALRASAGAAAFSRWQLLDRPSPEQARALLTGKGMSGRGARRVLIASRPDDALARVLLTPRIYGSVEVIDDAELYLTHADCRAQIDAQLFAETGGWPVLVDAWAFGSREATQELLPEFLEREFLPALPQALATAMFAAAGAPLSAAAVEFLFERGRCTHPLLRTIGSQTVIASRWVRNALVALRTSSRAMVPAVREQLAELYANFADPVGAILSMMEIGESTQALEIFMRAGGAFFGYRHGYQALARVLESFAPQQEQRSDELFYARLWLMIKSGQPREALLRLEARHPGLPVDLRRMRLSHRPMAVLLRIDISLDIDETPPLEVIASWGRLQALLPAGNELALGLLFNTMAIGFLQADALLEAEQMATEALAAYRRARSPYLVHFMLLHLCDISLRQSRLTDAAEKLRDAEAALRDSGMTFNSEPAIVESFKSRIAYEEGRFVDCPAETEPILEALLRGDSWPDLIASMAGHFVLTAFWGRGLRKALERLDHFALTLSRRHGSTRHEGMELVRIRLLQVARRHAEAGMRLEEYDLHRGGSRSAHLEAEEGLIRLRHALVQERLGADALPLAASLAGRPSLELRHRISLAVLQAFLRHRSGDSGLARRNLRHALREAEASNLLGALAEEGEFLERLLPLLIAEPGLGNTRLAAFAQRVLRLLHSLPAAPMHSKAVAGISRQEHRVLSYLVDGYTNKQIARALALSESTVKFHLRGLFRKLRVSNRSALTETALKRGIVT